MEGIFARLDAVAKIELPPEESVDIGAEQLAKVWSVSGVQSQPMEDWLQILK